jgi:hypothetical protein
METDDGEGSRDFRTGQLKRSESARTGEQEDGHTKCHFLTTPRLPADLVLDKHPELMEWIFCPLGVRLTTQAGTHGNHRR